MINLPHNAPQSFDWIIKFNSFSASDTKVTVVTESARGVIFQLDITSPFKNCWNYRFTKKSSVFEKHTDSLIEGNKLCALETEDSNDELIIRSGDVAMKIQKEPWTASFHDKNGKTLLRENQSDIDGLGRLFIMPLGMMEENNLQKMTQTYFLAQDEYIFGFGEKFTRLNKHGQRITSWNQDAFGSTSERSHKNIPFYLSNKGYGLYLNSSAKIEWDAGVTSCQSLSFTVEENQLDCYLFFEKEPEKILEQYTYLTGRPVMPPKWSFGLWVSSGGTYRDQQAMEKLIEGLEEHSVPADVVHIDPWWMHWRKYCDFQWNREAFPELERFIEETHRKGLRICLWEQPYISIESRLFEDGKEKGYFVQRSDGEVYIIDYGLSLAPRPDGIIRNAGEGESWNAPVAIIDFTNSDAVEWFKDLHRPVLQMGVDVMKTDFGEDVPYDAVFANGKTGKEMHNLYPLLYNKAVAEVTEEEKGHSLVWARSAAAGSQRYPVCWSADPGADFPSLACTIRGGLSAALSGLLLWSNDIGGYRGMPEDELYIRWAQFGLLCSHSRMHGDSPREPWYFSGSANAIVTEMIRLRYRLFPYIYETAQEAAERGIPFLRPMFLTFPEDPLTYHCELQYMIGDSLLAAPVYEADGKVSVYFPDGEWAEWFGGAIYSGTSSVTLHPSLDKIPLFIRADAVIPLMKGLDRIPENGVEHLEFLIFPVTGKSFYYSDEKGTVTLEFTNSEEQLTLSIESSVERNIAFRIYTGGDSLSIFGDGEESPLQKETDSIYYRTEKMITQETFVIKRKVSC